MTSEPVSPPAATPPSAMADSIKKLILSPTLLTKKINY
jgi:hypothetical protein